MKCRIQCYDPEVVEAPFTFIQLGEFDFTEEELHRHPDPLTRGYELFLRKVMEKGFCFRFYSISVLREKYEYDITVHTPLDLVERLAMGSAKSLGIETDFCKEVTQTWATSPGV